MAFDRLSDFVLAMYPVSESPIISFNPPLSVATTGVPWLIDSRATLPNGSGQIEGTTVSRDSE